MQHLTLSVQDAIIEKHLFEDFECQICYSIALKPA